MHGAIQEALRWMQYRPERGHYRVLILDEAERMNRESANAFLKTLEEPHLKQRLFY